MTKKLITSLDKGLHDLVRYCLVETNFNKFGGKKEGCEKISKETAYLAEAFCEFYEDYNEYYFFITEEVEKFESFKVVKKLLEKDYGKKVIVKSISMDRDQENIWNLFDQLDNIFNEGDSVIVDITFGFGDIPIYMISLLRYFKITRKIEVRAILYRTHDIEDSKSKIVRVFNLVPVDVLGDWADAVNTFLRFNSPEDLKKMLSIYLCEKLFPDLSKEFMGYFKELRNGVEEYNKGILLSNSEKVSKSAQEIVKSLNEIRKNLARIPYGDDFLPKPFRNLLDKIKDELIYFAQIEKKFNEKLIDRDLKLVEYYVDRGLMQQAATLLRELFIDYVIYSWKGEIEKDIWLDSNIRYSAEWLLNFLVNNTGKNLKYFVKSEAKEAIIRDLSRNFQSINNIRNIVNHAGRIRDKVEDYGDSIKSIVKALNRYLNDERLKGTINEILSRRESEDLPIFLITPLGFSLGLLYTVVISKKPSSIFILTSNKVSDQSIMEVLEKAGYSRVHLRVERLEDPFSDFEKYKSIIRADWFMDMVRGHKVVVNLTGGTTALQYNIERISNYLQKNMMEGSIKVVICIDDRPMDEQRSNPFVVGKCKEIEE